MCEKVYEGVKSLIAQINELMEKGDRDPNGEWLTYFYSVVTVNYFQYKDSHSLVADLF